MLQEYHRARPWPTAPRPHQSRAYNAVLRLAERPAKPAWRAVAESGQDFSVRVGRGETMGQQRLARMSGRGRKARKHLALRRRSGCPGRLAGWGCDG
jgi:hypothetical protein